MHSHMNIRTFCKIEILKILIRIKYCLLDGKKKYYMLKFFWPYGISISLSPELKVYRHHILMLYALYFLSKYTISNYYTALKYLKHSFLRNCPSKGINTSNLSCQSIICVHLLYVL